jgi:hypothetical protein
VLALGARLLQGSLEYGTRGSRPRVTGGRGAGQDDAPLGGNAVDHGGVPMVEYGGEVVQEHHRDTYGWAHLAVGERGPLDLHGLRNGILAG